MISDGLDDFGDCDAHGDEQLRGLVDAYPGLSDVVELNLLVLPLDLRDCLANGEMTVLNRIVEKC